MQIKMTKPTDIFPAPYTTDGVYIYDAHNQMCLMAGDCDNYPIEMLRAVCDILNGTKTSKGNAGVSADGINIYLNGDLLLVVRGWGHLTGCGGLHLDEEEAAKIQDDFAQHVVNCLRGEC